MKGNYDKVAPFYESLSHLVFGDAIINAQRFVIDAIPADCSVLIAGGGTGEILEIIAEKYSSGLRIVYVESSVRMIEIARKKSIGENQVTFINKSIQTASLDSSFDIVITPFFFDNFSDDTAKVVFDRIDVALKPEGLWLHVDFVLGTQSPLWQKLLLKFMYLFFRMTANIEAKRLPDIDLLFHTKFNTILSSKSFYSNFIRADIYRKQQ